MTRLIYSDTSDIAAEYFELEIVVFGIDKEVIMLKEYLQFLEWPINTHDLQQKPSIDAEDDADFSMKYHF